MTNKRLADENDLIIKFPTREDALEFASWLCNSGEQDFWNYQDESVDDIRPTLNFDYHNEDRTKKVNDPARYGEFMKDLIIRTYRSDDK